MAKVANPFAMGCVLSAIGLLALVLNSLIVVRYGRRRVLLMSGLGTCGVLQLIVAIVYDKNPGAKATGEVLVALSCLYMMSYNVRIPVTLLSTDVEGWILIFAVGNGSNIRLVKRRRTSITTTTQLHVRSSSSCGILRCVAYYLYGAL